MKKAFWAYLFIILLMPVHVAMAESNNQRVFDNVGILPDYSHLPNGTDYHQHLEGLVESTFDRCECDLAFLFIDDFIGYNTHESLAASFYDNMGLGFGDTRDGVLILIDINQQKTVLYPFGKCQSWVTDSVVEKVSNTISTVYMTETLDQMLFFDSLKLVLQELVIACWDYMY